MSVCTGLVAECWCHSIILEVVFCTRSGQLSRLYLLIVWIPFTLISCLPDWWGCPKTLHPSFFIRTVLGCDYLRDWSSSHRCFAAVLQRTFKDAHIYRGPMWLSRWPFTFIHLRVVLDSSVIFLIAVSISKCFDLQYKEENWSRAIRMESIPSQPRVMLTSVILKLAVRLYTIFTTWRIPERSLLHTSLTLGNTGIVHLNYKSRLYPSVFERAVT